MNTNEQPRSPRQLLGPIFDVVQLSQVFADSKTFVDAVPTKKIAKIQKDYKQQYGTQLDVTRFVEANFALPKEAQSPEQPTVEASLPVRASLSASWDKLTRESDRFTKNSSLLALPYKYIVPGGRFREIYYWDSYFTMLGLREDGRVDLIESMVQNFAYLIETYGFVPNGNRTYYLTRSQPPVFPLMVELLAEIKGESVYAQYQSAMTKEYAYWMKGVKAANFANRSTNTSEHVVRMAEGELLNRYWDMSISPREESFIEDVTVGKKLATSSSFYQNMRAGAESGWDYSSRWFADIKDKTSIQVTDLVPIDLNVLLLRAEEIIEHTYNLQHKPKRATIFADAARDRRAAMRKYLWNEQAGWYCDYSLTKKAVCEQTTIAGLFSLYGGVASAEQASQMHDILKEQYVRPGGVATTLVHSGEQWDAPNGWAPMQYICVAGLERYGHANLAEDIAKRWSQTNIDVYQKTGHWLEKYNIEEPGTLAGGGEYEVQTGFGWTNGVLLYFLNKYHLEQD